MLGLNQAEHGSSPENSLAPPPQRVGPPVLASQVLREELAPLEPESRSSRIWLAGIASSLLLLGLALSGGIGTFTPSRGAVVVTFASAAALLAVAGFPLPYGLRAGAASATGISMMFLGMRDIGPLAGLSADEGVARTLARVIAMTVVPAALLFRSHYRAYGRARLVLAAALLLALPFVVSELLLSLDSGAPWISRVAGLIDALVLAAAAVGFMGGGTTAAGSKWAAITLVVLSSGVAVHEFDDVAKVTGGPLAYPAAALGLLCAAMVTSIGFYQLLAAYFAADARRVAQKEPKHSYPPEVEDPAKEALSGDDESPNSLE